MDGLSLANLPARKGANGARHSSSLNATKQQINLSNLVASQVWKADPVPALTTKTRIVQTNNSSLITSKRAVGAERF